MGRTMTAETAAVSYAAGPAAPPLLETTIGADLAATTARFPDREALVDLAEGRRLTYREFRAQIRALATGLLGAGIAPGERVGIWAPNRWEWMAVQYATAEIGAILVNINPAYRLRELEYALTRSEIAMVIAAPEFKDADYA